MPQVSIIAFDECQASAISILIEALRVANLHWSQTNTEDEPPFSWQTVSWDGKPVQAMAGLTISVDASKEQLKDTDLVFVPAIRSDDLTSLNDSVETLNEIWGEILKGHHNQNGYIAANCSSTFLLAETGLLDNRTATTSWWLANRFKRSYPKVNLKPEKLVTKNQRLFCAAAFSACLNLGVEIVSEFLGRQAAISCARILLIDVNRLTQLPFANIQDQVKHNDELVLRAQSRLMSDLTNSVNLEKFAKSLGVTSRTLTRRFKSATKETPNEFLQNARVERAKRLLESTNMSTSEVTVRVGYDDVSSFRRLFIRKTGISPREYRKRFGE